MIKAKLSDLKRGEQGRILSIETSELKVSLMHLGIVAGDLFELTNIAPFGDPVAISVNGTKVSFRKRDASFISVERL
jgi:ferrous iron transport protein A